MFPFDKCKFFLNVISQIKAKATLENDFSNDIPFLPHCLGVFRKMNESLPSRLQSINTGFSQQHLISVEQHHAQG